MARGTPEERFLAQVRKTESCWVWTAATTTGYGRLKIDGRRVYSHRFSYETYVGSIPAGMEVDHRCHNRACVNPQHLRLVTRKQNNENHSGAYSNSKSGVRGVHWHQNQKKWQGRVRHNGHLIHVGYFDKIEDAENAVIEKRNELFTHNDLDRVNVGGPE